MQKSKYVLRNSTNGQFYWVLRSSGNSEVILTSETYHTKQGALAGIQSSKLNIADRNFDRKNSIQFYFNQVAGNNQIIGTSEMYNSTQARENGISAVKRDAPTAIIEDLTYQLH